MNTYPSYKDSGVDWINEIPSGWGYSSLKYILKRKISDGPHETPVFTDEGIPFLSVDGIQNGELVFDGCRYISHEDHNRYKRKCPIEKNDILMGKAASIGKIARVKVDFPISVWSPLAIIKPKEDVLNFVFLEYSLTSTFLQDQIEIYSTSNTQKNISMNDIQRLQIVFPTLQEQQQISNYLDYKTSKIDFLIEKTEQKIELLKEQRTSLINTTVTKGLNPNVEMKDSGVEWIGEIPSGWNIKKLKYISSLKTDKNETNKGDIKISPENVESYTGVCFNLYSDHEGKGVVFKSGDILFNKLRLYLVKIILPNYAGYSMGEMIVIRMNKDIENKFYFYTFFNQGFIDLLNSQSTGVKLPRVSPDVIMDSKLPLPPLQEQQQIVDYLDKKTSKIDELTNIESKRIKLLKEYRQSLISDVITGKVDVRNEVLA